MCALLPNGSYFMPYWKFHWTSLLLQQDKLLDAPTHPLNVCVLLIDLLDSGGICTGWMKVLCARVCVCVCIGCGAGVHLLSLISYWPAFHIWTVWRRMEKERRVTDFTIFVFLLYHLKMSSTSRIFFALNFGSFIWIFCTVQRKHKLWT